MKIGAQMYSLRKYAQNEADLGRSLEKVAKMGYKVVQLSGIGPIEPKKVKALCDANGLEIALTHNGENKFQNVDALIEEHQIYQCKYIGLGSMPDRYRCAEWVDYFKEDFEKPIQKIHDAGMLFMYHNHSFEFEHLANGQTIMDKLLSFFPADYMGITADTYWLQHAGVDLYDWLEAHADRMPCMHLKDMAVVRDVSRFGSIGSGNINFKKVLDILSKNGVTQYALVEQDDSFELPAFACMADSIAYIRSLGYQD